MSVKKLEVRLTRAIGEERVVGLLAEHEHRLFFEYDPEFLREPLWLSPFKLKPDAGLHEHRDRDFGPLFGLFDDSLPDGWGLLLMDRFFSQQRKVLAEVSALDRLAFLGSRTMGALTYHPPSDPAEERKQFLDLYEMARASEEILAGRAEEVLPRLVRAGGSPGGARPKVLIGLRGDEVISGESELPKGFGAWIVKFNAQNDASDTGAVEMAYSLMARDAGIIMPPTRLFETAAGDRFFGVERFDRRAGRRYHVHTLGNLIQANFRIPCCDYEQLLEVTRILTRDLQAVLQNYRRTVFNVLTHNRDDHVKNFAFRMTDNNEWELTPAYDLVFSPGPGGEHTTTVAGEGRTPGRQHLLRLAATSNIPEQAAVTILDEVAESVRQWKMFADQAGVSQTSLRQVEKKLDECLARL